MRGRVFGARLALALGIAALGSLAWGSAGAGAYVYWADSEAGTIGRAANDGTHVEPDFIAGAGTPISLAVTGSSIFWANGGPTTPSAARAFPAARSPRTSCRGTRKSPRSGSTKATSSGRKRAEI